MQTHMSGLIKKKEPMSTLLCRQSPVFDPKSPIFGKQEPCIAWTHTHVGAHFRIAVSKLLYHKSPVFDLKSPIFGKLKIAMSKLLYHKSPVFDLKSPIFGKQETCIAWTHTHVTHPNTGVNVEKKKLLYHRLHGKCYTPEIHQIEKLRFLGTNLNWTKNFIQICTARYPGIWVSRFGGFRGCSICSGNCHTRAPYLI